MSNKKGFTLLEVLLVVGIIAILAGIVILAINPARQLAQARNAERASDIKQINNAIIQYYIDNSIYPATASTTALEEICDTGSASSTEHTVDCDGLTDLSILVPTYIVSIPVDPQGPVTSFLDKLITKVLAATNGTSYYTMIENKKVVITAPQAELDVIIAIGTTTVAEGGEVIVCDTTCQALRVGLVAYYPFDNDIDDYFGENDATEVGTVTFNGTDNFLGDACFEVVNPTNGDNFVNTPLTSDPVQTISLWAKGNGFVLSSCLPGHDDGSFIILATDSYVELRSIAGWEPSITVTGVNVNANWTHIVLVNDNANHYLYINGQLGGTYSGNSVTGDKPIALGHITYYPLANYTYDGLIDESAIWSRALTPTEVSQLYNSGSGRSLIQ